MNKELFNQLKKDAEDIAFQYLEITNKFHRLLGRIEKLKLSYKEKLELVEATDELILDIDPCFMELFPLRILNE